MDFSEVKALLDKWRRVNSATVEWQTRIGAQAKADGYLVNPFGRKRWFYTDSYWTESLSFLPQSTGADIMHRAAIGLLWSRIGLAPEFVAEYVPVFRVLPRECRLVLQVHDSFLWEFPGELADEVQATVGEVMTQGWRELGGMSIPIDCKLGEPGQSWGELETI
jgi:DNA polymerase I-like protein with 3'-5' exonuclease and polymerase domains